MHHAPLFTPVSLGSLELPNRILMAPLTRCRADADHVPTDLMVEYYRQRATAGLIVTEATMVIEGNSAPRFVDTEGRDIVLERLSYSHF